ncbi:MAG: metalloregulator ArsR/SmtB family transcription factor [Bryobacteraceae bacterium]
MQDHLSSTFSALADPTRRAILARLALGETSVTELARPFEMSMPAVTKHLKVLERAGLISRGREAQWRPCKLEAAPLKDIAGWVEHYRQFWEQSFDRLDEYLRELQAQETGGAQGNQHEEHQPKPGIKDKKKKRKRVSKEANHVH